ncbi:hypothetical protein ACI0X9_003272 [Cronobacter turicensis]
MSDVIGTSYNGIISISIELLMTGHDLYVNKNDYTPAKINAKESSYFQRDSYVLDQPVDLCWTSKRGFRVGVVFTGQCKNAPVMNSFPLHANAFIAYFDLDKIGEALHQVEAVNSRDIIKDVMTKPNAFSYWLYWPQYPLTSAAVKVSNATIYPVDFLPYDLIKKERVHSFESGNTPGSFMTQNPLLPVVKLLGSLTSKTTGERVYRFSVTLKDVTEKYHVMAYEGDYYLLDYAYDSVPCDNPMREPILAACCNKLPSLGLKQQQRG